MKKIICSLFMFLLLSTSVVYAEGNPILLVGEAPIGPIKFPPPISAEQGDGEVLVFFKANIGLIDICVKNAQGNVVYQIVVDTVTTPDLIIGTTSWSPEDYVLILTFGNGTRLIGEFSL
ncbi:MAG: DUF3244 domain-containing protein [Prevotellaceae bacterium]|jgi:hypothetical protein|nr:DUF3244 domain-containing protein [Prevotellaceae bacterium]